MIRYALACEAGHAFESWFRDSDTFDAQQKAGFVTCPACGSATVEKQIMAPSVARTDRDRPALPVPAESAGPPAEPAPAAPVALLTEREAAFRELLRAVRRHVVETAENVGPRFAVEARRMHDGLSEFRAIYGEATLEEALALAEEGIEALPLPSLPDEHN
jgi:hypothetical protein